MDFKFFVQTCAASKFNRAANTILALSCFLVIKEKGNVDFNLLLTLFKDKELLTIDRS